MYWMAQRWWKLPAKLNPGLYFEIRNWFPSVLFFFFFLSLLLVRFLWCWFHYQVVSPLMVSKWLKTAPQLHDPSFTSNRNKTLCLSISNNSPKISLDWIDLDHVPISEPIMMFIKSAACWLAQAKVHSWSSEECQSHSDHMTGEVGVQEAKKVGHDGWPHFIYEATGNQKPGFISHPERHSEFSKRRN